MGKLNSYFTCLKFINLIEVKLYQDGGSDGKSFPEAEECLLEQQGRSYCRTQGQGGQLRRQEMPLHWPRPDPRQNPQRSRPEAQDAAHRCHQERLSSFHQKIQEI